MRTGRSLTVWRGGYLVPGGLPGPGGCTWSQGGGGLLPGGCVYLVQGGSTSRGGAPGPEGVPGPGGAPGQVLPPLWTEWHTRVKILPWRNFVAAGN